MEALKHVGAGGSDDPLPAHVAERRESHDDVVRVLATLPPRQQEVVRLKFQDGLSYKEISAVTGLSTSNVGYTIHVAVKAMREQMLSGTGALLEGHRSAP